MADTTPESVQEQMRRWLANWREVNEAEDEQSRTGPAPDPATCLETGLSLIDFVLRSRTPDAQVDEWSTGRTEAVRRTWRRLRAAHIR